MGYPRGRGPSLRQPPIPGGTGLRADFVLKIP